MPKKTRKDAKIKVIMNIEQEIVALKERNTKVEADKGWETSWTRKLSLALLTYVVAVAWLFVIGEHLVLLKAIVPVAGFVLSTLTLPPLKKWWLRTYAK